MFNKTMKIDHKYCAVVVTGFCCLFCFEAPLAYGQAGFSVCAEIQSSLERLTCYDKVMANNTSSAEVALPIDDNESVNVPVAADRPTAITAPATVPSPISAAVTDPVPVATGAIDPVLNQDDFGLELKQAASVETDERAYKVLSARHNDFTGWTIEFESGGTWRQVGTKSFSIDVGDTYTIRRATLNSFLLSGASSNRKIRVSRLD